MFFKKYKSHYSLNFYSACGWISFLGIVIAYLNYLGSLLFQKENTMDILVPLIITFIWFFVFYITITFFIFMVETFYEIKINNQRFLNNIFIDIMRIIGTVFASIPILFLIIAFIFLKH